MKPDIKFKKQRLGKDDEFLHCTLCDYGKKKGIILWRVEFTGKNYSFHWLLCNPCRFLIFKAMGGRRINRSDDWKQLLAKPTQKIPSKGKVRTSFYFSQSWDRQKALDNGESLQEYETRMKKESKKMKRH